MKKIVFDDVVTFMQRIQDCASKGLERYVRGEISLEKWTTFQKHMTAQYDLDISDSTRSKRRKAGEAVARLYGFKTAGKESKVIWMMMVSPGLGRLPSREKLESIRTKRIPFGNYELVHDGKTWTWQMKKEKYSDLLFEISHLARRSINHRRIHTREDGSTYDVEAEAWLDRLYLQPGFRLIRRQVGTLVAKGQEFWKQYRPENGPKLEARPFLGYVRRRPNKPTSLFPKGVVSENGK